MKPYTLPGGCMSSRLRTLAFLLAMLMALPPAVMGASYPGARDNICSSVKAPGEGPGPLAAADLHRCIACCAHAGSAPPPALPAAHVLAIDALPDRRASEPAMPRHPPQPRHARGPPAAAWPSSLSSPIVVPGAAPVFRITGVRT